jgi:hypothetical protein
LISDIEKFLPVAIFKMATSIGIPEKQGKIEDDQDQKEGH